MEREQRDNEGIVFPNAKKTTDKHPDFTGRAMVNGVMYWVSAWNKAGQKTDFTTLAFQEMNDQHERPATGSSPPGQRQAVGRRVVPDADERQFSDSDVPF